MHSRTIGGKKASRVNKAKITKSSRVVKGEGSPKVKETSIKKSDNETTSFTQQEITERKIECSESDRVTSIFFSQEDILEVLMSCMPLETLKSMCEVCKLKVL